MEELLNCLSQHSENCDLLIEVEKSKSNSAETSQMIAAYQLQNRYG